MLRDEKYERSWKGVQQNVYRAQDLPELIEAIEASLSQGRVTALTALHGLGGIGKSQLARRFAELRTKTSVTG